MTNYGGKRGQFIYKGKGTGFSKKFEEVESGVTADLKIFKPELRNFELVEETLYWLTVNQDFINDIEKVEAELEDTGAVSIDISEVDNELVEFKSQDTVFNTLSKVKCKIEKKGRYNYVSWTNAWKEVKTRYPNVNFKVHTTDDGYPAFINDHGGFVKVSVTLNEQTYTEFYPITDNTFKTISPEKIDVMHINNSIKRGMVKALAYLGLGLYVYDGEDLPEK